MKLLSCTRRKAKLKYGTVDDSVDVISNLSGVSMNEIVGHQMSEPLVPPAHENMESIHVAEGMSIPKLCFLCSLGGVPRRQRSKQRVIYKKSSAVGPGKIVQGLPILTHSTERARTKRKIKQVSEDSSVAEQNAASSFRDRGQSKRRANKDTTIAQPEEKLDSEKLYKYLKNLWQSFSNDKRNRFTYLDCLWFSMYTEESSKLAESSKTKVLSWIKRKDIFSKKYVFLPIVKWGHWSLLIFCHLGENVQSRTRTPCMLLLDSLQMADPKRLEPWIRKFLLGIYKVEERPETKEMIYKIPLLVPKVPQQRNADECGNYVLYYLNLFLEHAPENFSIYEGYPYFLKEDWFTAEGLDSFCKMLDSTGEAG